MAKMFPPSIKGYEEEHYSEIEVYMFLKYMLPDDYYVFWNMRVDNNYPDFIIVEPTLGLLVLEVKDWALETIYSSNAKYFYFKPNNNSKLNPLEQATRYKNKIENVLKAEENLLQNDGIYKGNLKFCRACGVVFTNIEKLSFLNSSHKDSIDQTLILFKDEIKDIENRKDIGLLRKKFEDMFIPENSFCFEPLFQKDMDIIKKIIYKESVPCNEDEFILDRDSDSISPQHEETISSYELSSSSNKPNVKKKNQLKYTSSKKYWTFKKTILVLIISIIVISPALKRLFHLPYNFPKVFASFVENFIDKRTEAFSQNQENNDIDNQPLMIFKVGSHPGAKGTFILIKDGKKYLTSKIFTEGSTIEFYEDKKIIINDAKSDKKEFIIENDVIDLEVGNTYTKIYLNGEEYKFVKNFKFDFMNKKIVKLK
ncbi:nuclease-related domain-containing protein [Proteiniborus sp. MB09-C3]|uniref:nuclease-related domain-containing protein n=1 Tax=Proteiniborus sp. MB09-C3 TaxID=3050072 RepID=UPI00255526B5|nr:nuclease-related domain-containing protein [Proteiniborus sp. MB09-C3]WIV11081.1 nuclease-related domain-containing protein [Proteiniborus sp. MB09-C3]